eukprot:12548956-Alexandrium_andersonii.AAC.1
MARVRKYTLMFLKGRIVFTGSVDGFEELFRRQPLCSGDVFFAAPPEILDKHLHAFARRQKMNPAITSRAFADWRPVYTAAEQKRLAEFYTSHRAQHGEEEHFLADISQSLEFGQCGPFMPSLLRHSR